MGLAVKNKGLNLKFQANSTFLSLDITGLPAPSLRLSLQTVGLAVDIKGRPQVLGKQPVPFPCHNRLARPCSPPVPVDCGFGCGEQGAQPEVLDQRSGLRDPNSHDHPGEHDQAPRSREWLVVGWVVGRSLAVKPAPQQNSPAWGQPRTGATILGK